MANVQLIINNQIADVFPGADIVPSVSFSISDINDVEKRKSPTTKTIKLPATNRNRRIFGFPDDVTVTSFKGQKVSLPGSVRESGTEILSGVVNLKSFQRNSKEEYFEITVVGNSAEWIEAMAASSLRSLGNDGQHNRTAAVIEASYVGTLPYAYGLINEGHKGGELRISSIEDDGNGKCLCMIDGTNEVFRIGQVLTALNSYVNGYRFDNPAYNGRHEFDSIVTVDGINQAVKLKTRYLGNSSGIFRPDICRIQTEDMALLVNLEKLLAKMFKDAGYRIQSDFISSDYFKSLFVLPGTEYRTESECEEQRVKVGLSADATGSGVTNYQIPFDTVIEGKASNWDTSLYRFQGSAGWKVRIKAKIRIKGTPGYRANVRFATTPITNNYGGGVSTTIIELSSDYQELSQEGVYRLASGDKIMVNINMPSMGGVSGNIIIAEDGTEVECILEPDYVKDSTITPYSLLPDVKQVELLKGVRGLFNLHFLTDVNKKVVYIEPRDTFYKRTSIVDWSTKMDISQPFTLEELGADLPRLLTFRYKEDGDDWGVEQDNKATGGKYSTHSVTLNNMFSGKDEKVIEVPFFAATLMDTYDSAGLTISKAPKIWQESEAGDIYPEVNKSYVPRILCFAGLRDCDAGESWTFEGTTKTEYPFFYSHDADSVNENSLLFKPQAGIPDLFSKYYANYIRTLNESRKVTCFMKLTPVDIQPIITLDPDGGLVRDFRSLFYLKNGAGVFPCRLESINDYAAGANKPTKVVFVTDSDNIFDQLTPFVSSMEFYTGGIALGTTYANAWISRYATLWSDCRNSATGSFTSNTMSRGAGARKTTTAYEIERMFLFFDTSDIPNGATITEVYLDIYKIAGDLSQEVAVFSGTQSNIVTNNDYQKFGAASFGESQSGNLGLRRIVFNEAGRAAISKTGWTKLCLRNVVFDVMNVQPSIAYQTFKTYLYNPPDNYRNKLTVKYIE